MPFAVSPGHPRGLCFNTSQREFIGAPSLSPPPAPQVRWGGGSIYLRSRQGSWACASTSLPDPITPRAPEWLGRGTLLHPQSEAGLSWDTYC